MVDVTGDFSLDMVIIPYPVSPRAGRDVTRADQPVGSHRVTSDQLLLDAPANPSTAKSSIEQETTIDVYGASGDYLFVEHKGLNGWIRKL